MRCKEQLTHTEHFNISQQPTNIELERVLFFWFVYQKSWIIWLNKQLCSTVTANIRHYHYYLTILKTSYVGTIYPQKDTNMSYPTPLFICVVVHWKNSFWKIMGVKMKTINEKRRTDGFVPNKINNMLLENIQGEFSIHADLMLGK